MCYMTLERTCRKHSCASVSKAIRKHFGILLEAEALLSVVYRRISKTFRICLSNSSRKREPFRSRPSTPRKNLSRRTNSTIHNLQALRGVWRARNPVRRLVSCFVSIALSARPQYTCSVRVHWLKLDAAHRDLFPRSDSRFSVTEHGFEFQMASTTASSYSPRSSLSNRPRFSCSHLTAGTWRDEVRMKFSIFL